jgi:hypothetical protein
MTLISEMYQGIDKIDRFNWKSPDLPGALEYIDKAKLMVDSASYQRNYSDTRSLEMARAWSWVALGALIVARRPDGSLWVVDGQHRLMAARRRSDVSKLPCVVFEVSDLASEAAGFVRSNTARRAMTMVDRFRAMLVSGDADAIFIRDLLATTGHIIAQGGGTSAGKKVGCAALLLNLSAADKALVSEVWPVIAEIFRARPVHERVVSGVFYIAKVTKGQVLEPMWRAKLLRVGADGLVEACGRASAFYTAGGSKVWATGIVEELNRGQRTNVLHLSQGGQA